MKLKIGRIYLAKWVSDYKLDDPPDYYWFAIIYARRVDGGIIYLGVKTGMPAKDLDGIPHAFWFDTAENEWAETMNKARAIFRAVSLAEAGLDSNRPEADA